MFIQPVRKCIRNICKLVDAKDHKDFYLFQMTDNMQFWDRTDVDHMAVHVSRFTG